MSTLEKILEKKKILDSKRPFKPEILTSLEKWYEVELTYSSNAIEGNTLTRTETAIVLEKGITVRGKSLKDHVEIVDSADALSYVKELVRLGNVIGEREVKEIHYLSLLRSDRTNAGQYSSVERLIAGSSVKLTPALDIPNKMREFGHWLSSDEGAKHAIEAHLRLVSIHPFNDGNGRTARLLMNLLLIKSGYPPLIVSPADRPDYIDAIEKSQLTGDANDYFSFMYFCLYKSLEKYLDAICEN